MNIHCFIWELKGLKYRACKYAQSFCCVTFALGNCSISLERFILETFFSSESVEFVALFLGFEKR